MGHAEFRRRRILSTLEKRAYLQRQVESGKTQSAFCVDEGIALSSFQSWKKKFAGEPSFVEIAAPRHIWPVSVEVVLSSGARVVTTSDCDPVWLATLVRSFGATPC